MPRSSRQHTANAKTTLEEEKLFRYVNMRRCVCMTYGDYMATPLENSLAYWSAHLERVSTLDLLEIVALGAMEPNGITEEYWHALLDLAIRSAFLARSSVHYTTHQLAPFHRYLSGWESEDGSGETHSRDALHYLTIITNAIEDGDCRVPAGEFRAHAYTLLAQYEYGLFRKRPASASAPTAVLDDGRACGRASDRLIEALFAADKAAGYGGFVGVVGVGVAFTWREWEEKLHKPLLASATYFANNLFPQVDEFYNAQKALQVSTTRSRVRVLER